ncbi:splicing factor YJU2 [Lepeophtheirus salmonis]|uniref:splicing factor YJU2 n=1 Tax=Lepeophtheirus salmonis TaxID=72036 RepID=UPI001AEACD1A|nr:splicing factor YJU2-like [Lepeophtheirus salmonis]
MSERKVLNKYYPPDFDPSKIPRSKIPRNKTFTIRLMAPCNMRCSTCGEYIYKGRKFNARKEDVDEMNHLGLRIYRFYIKCTACLSEISFRTDPENTDYVLEAGATRNFEALAKAEKQAELEDKAYQEELKNNPMKLLEERTEASKNEMERMEALEELRELNKRELKINFDNMLGTYEKQRTEEIAMSEREDEEFVRSVFGRNSHDEVVKRIYEEDIKEDESEPKFKVPKVEKVTDFLAQPENDTEIKKEAWQKSIGSLSSKKKGIGVLVKKKTPEIKKEPQEVPPINTEGVTVKKEENQDSSSSQTSQNTESKKVSHELPKLNAEVVTVKKEENVKSSTSHAIGLGSLGLLGNYSDSDGSDSN